MDKFPMIQLQEWIKRQQTCLCSFRALSTESDQASYAALIQLLGKRMIQVRSDLCKFLTCIFIHRLCVCCGFVDGPFWRTSNSECHLFCLPTAHHEPHCCCYLSIDWDARYIAQGNPAAYGRGLTASISSSEHASGYDPSFEINVPGRKATNYEPVVYSSQYHGRVSHLPPSCSFANCYLETATATSS